jgi:hypothetical protein
MRNILRLNSQGVIFCASMGQYYRNIAANKKGAKYCASTG